MVLRILCAAFFVVVVVQYSVRIFTTQLQWGWGSYTWRGRKTACGSKRVNPDVLQPMRRSKSAYLTLPSSLSPKGISDCLALSSCHALIESCSA